MISKVKPLRERDIEILLVELVKIKGGYSRKLQYINHCGAPDRIVFFNGLIHLVELKAPGKSLSIVQSREHNQLRRHGITVHVIDSVEGVHRFIAGLS